MFRVAARVGAVEFRRRRITQPSRGFDSCRPAFKGKSWLIVHPQIYVLFAVGESFRRIFDMITA